MSTALTVNSVLFLGFTGSKTSPIEQRDTITQNQNLTDLTSINLSIFFFCHLIALF